MVDSATLEAAIRTYKEVRLTEDRLDRKRELLNSYVSKLSGEQITTYYARTSEYDRKRDKS